MLMEFLSAIKQTLNGNLSKSLDVLIQEKTTEINAKVDGKANQTSIGVTTDAGGTSTRGSIFAKLNKFLTDWNATRAGYLDTTISSRATQTSVNNLQTTANAIKAKMDGISSSSGVVKRVQRGVFSYYSNTTIATIDISAINPNKSIVLLNGDSEARPTNGDGNPAVILEQLSDTSIQIRSTAKGYIVTGMRISWQVIEFY